MAENFYDRLDEILDNARAGHKRRWTVDALDALYAEQRQAEVERLRAELADCKRLSTNPTRDEATGLETLCAFLHASGSADPNVIKDVAWRTFGLIRAWREQGDERDRLAEQVKRAQDPDLIRRAIADPGAYVKRKLDNGEPTETLPAWGARAVIAALDGTEAGS